jgi:hypothetical protein
MAARIGGGRSLGRAGLLAAAALGLAGAGPAPQDFPATTTEADILRWTRAHTSIDRGSILSIGSQAVIAFERRTGTADDVVSAEVREELIGPDLAARAQARSVRITLDLDCAAHRYRILGRTLFALADLQGQGRNEAGSQGWAQVDETAPIGKAWQAVCTPGFVFPYATAAAPVPALPVRPPEKGPAAPLARPPAPPARPAAPPRSGAYEVLLGSYTVPANAQGAADKLTRGFADALAGRKPAIRAATVGGKAFSVVTVAPFASAADASGFCARIKPSGLVCVAKTREASRPPPAASKQPPF